MTESIDLKFMCAYCTKTVYADEADAQGVAHVDIETGHVIQQWYSHVSCFRERLHPSVQIFYDDEPHEEAFG